jgi:hypothetical protein
MRNFERNKLRFRQVKVIASFYEAIFASFYEAVIASFYEAKELFPAIDCNLYSFKEKL